MPRASACQIGWEGEWGCNLCGRAILHDDPLLRGETAASDVEAVCPVDGPRALIIVTWHMVLEAGSVCRVAHSRYMQVALLSMAKTRLNRHAMVGVSLLPIPCPQRNHFLHHAHTISFLRNPLRAIMPPPTRLCTAPFCCMQPAFCKKSARWDGAIRSLGSKFEDLCRRPRLELCDVIHLAQAFAELLEI